MSSQRQIRRAVSGTQNARTLQAGELDFDTTNKRLSVHDGSKVGGIKHATGLDLLNQTFSACAVTGTDTKVGALYDPPAAYADGQKFSIKVATTNTGACTVNFNSLGAKTIKKRDAAGALTDVIAGDLVAGNWYDLQYDGTYMQLLGGRGLLSVGQGDLRTSTGTLTQNAGWGLFTAPGGSYGFYPQLKTGAGSLAPAEFGCTIGYPAGTTLGLDTTFTAYIALKGRDSFYNIIAQQRYITSSPPFDLGDGEVGGFIYVRLNSVGEIVSTYAADVPPWAYNGPTDITAAYSDRGGKKYRKVMREKTLEEILDDPYGRVEYQYQEITNKIKNADMNLIPHPFGNLNPGDTVVLLDPMDLKIKRLIELQNAGGDISEFMDYVAIDNEILKRKGPTKIRQVSFTTSKTLAAERREARGKK